MAEPLDFPDAAPPPRLDPPLDPERKKKKDKVRSAWISFVGRIVAQVIGAIATIALTVYFVQRAQEPRGNAPAAPEPARPARTRPAGSEPALAVLPLGNYSGDPQQDYFADGMTEAIIADLASLSGLRVISRTSSMAYRGQRRTLPEIASELGVDLIVEGSVVKVGDRVRVTAQLIDAKTDEHLWAESYEKTMKDVLALQAEVAQAIAKEVVGVVQATSGRLASRVQVDPAAYDLYLRGRRAWNLRTPEGFDDAILYFEKALALSPNFALAYTGLADAYQLRQGGGRDNAARALAAAEQAVKLKEDLGEAHASLGGVLHRSRVEIAAAEREFKRAIELNPGYATSHQWYAILLTEEGRDAEALQHARRAVSLDPLAPAMHQTLALVHYNGRRFDEAASSAGRALSLAPRLVLARDLLARARLAQGRAEDAIAVWSGEDSPGPDAQATLALAYLQSGQRARADAIVKELTTREPPADGALVRFYAGSGNTSAALAALQRLVSRGPNGLRQLRTDPQLDPLRSDARFSAVMQRADPLTR